MTMRDVAGVIAEAVEVGRLNGVESLKGWRRTVFFDCRSRIAVRYGG